jgi:hypothetical protein
MTLLLCGSMFESRLNAREVPLSPDEATLLQVLIDGQHAAIRAFPRGRVVGVARDDYLQQRARFEAAWDGQKFYLSAQTEVDRIDSDGAPYSLQRDHVTIRNESGWENYEPAAKLLSRSPPDRPGIWAMLIVCPDGVWFRERPLDKERVVDLLAALPRLNGGERKVTVADVGQQRVLAKIEHLPSGGYTEFTFALDKGCNCIETTAILNSPSGQRTGRHVTFDWAPVGDGRWRLREYRYRSRTDPDETREIVIRLDEFEADPDLPDDRFHTSSLNPAAGTLVQEFGANERRYRLGSDSEVEQGIEASTFESLATELKHAGFASKP